MEATFGGGCFWCTEVIFQHTKGVEKVLPGYMGGRIENPTYEQVCMGNTDHVEGVRIEFDESQVSFQELLEIFFKTHDPTTLNRQEETSGRSTVLWSFSTTINNDKKRKTLLVYLKGKRFTIDPLLLRWKRLLLLAGGELSSRLF